MHRRVRGATASSLRETPQEPLLDGSASLSKALKSGNFRERLAAIFEISSKVGRGEMAHQEAGGMLSGCFEDENKEVRRSALMALAQHGSRMIEAFRVGLKSGDEDVRCMSATMIYRALSGDRQLLRNASLQPDEKSRGLARDLYCALLDGKHEVRIYALSALRELAYRDPLAVLDELTAFMNETLDGKQSDSDLGCRLDIVKKAALKTIEGKARENVA